jgi:hypothetical protein
MYALGRNVHCIPLPEVERVLSLCAQVISLVIGDDGKGLRRLTAQELVGFVTGVSRPIRKLGMATEALHQVEAECVRRGLDKFKAADLASLLCIFRLTKHKADRELLEAIQERVMRRGYLTNGRGGETSPKDVVRLLKVLFYHYGRSEMPLPIINKFHEVIIRAGFLEGLRDEELESAMAVEAEMKLSQIGRTTEPARLAAHILTEMASRVQPRRGQDGVDPSMRDMFFRTLAHGRQAIPPEVVDLARRLTKAWVADVAEGRCEMDKPAPFFVQLHLRFRLGLFTGEDGQHWARVLSDELARLLCADGFSHFFNDHGFQISVLGLWRPWGYYPGDEFMDMMVDRYVAVEGTGVHESLGNFLLFVQDAEQMHGYKVTGDLADKVLRAYSSAPRVSNLDVLGTCLNIERLCASFYLAEAQQPVVDAFIRHIGDPEELVKGACGEPDARLTARLTKALDHLKRVASGGDVAK